MGENEGWPEVPGGVVFPNGLLPNASPLIQALDSARWSKAEERTAELIACIQPNVLSEERRNAVAEYVQRLIMKCFPCQVFTFGSVPLKTYLPDGDIDLTAFSYCQTFKDTWANQVRDILEDEEKNENAEFQVKEVQYIQAEVKLIKCLVENIVVDISFNQLGGLCTLCFLEEVDHLISRNHLFKRSIILIKAWCYYESRVLGAHHGLISTYALETLVLYIFHVFNNSFAGPLEVLYRFLEFFSNFDWDNFCVSLRGPVRITSLPVATPKPPRKDDGELLMSKLFLDACSSVYAVFPGGQDNQGHQFVSKHFNVIDPLRVNNNLGRSVGKGNFFRIRSAFAFGAKKLARLLDCPKENLVYEVNQFFTNTWERHGSGNRPDVPTTDLLSSRFSTSHGYDSLSNGLIAKKVNSNISDRDTEVDKIHTRKSSSQLGNYPSEKIPTPQSQKGYGSLNSSRVFDQAIRASNPKLFVNDIPGRLIFARTRSSPDLTDTSVGLSPQGRRNNAPESGKNQATFTRIEYNNSIQNNCSWKKETSQSNKQHGSENIENYGARSSGSDHSPIRNIPTNESLDAVKSNSSLNSINVQRMDEEEQDLVNMMASTNFHGFNGQQLHMPINLASGHLPFPISPSILASMGYNHQKISGMVPPNFHFIDPSLSQMHFPQGLVPPQLAQYFPGNLENRSVPNNEKNYVVEMNSEECNNHELLHEQDNRNYEVLQWNDKPESSSIPLKNVLSSKKNQKNVTKERPIRENHIYQENGNDYPDDKSAASRLSSAGQSSSLRSRTSSESSWDGSSTKVSRTIKEKRGKKSAHADPSSSYEKIKNVNEHNIEPVEDDEVWDADVAVPHGYELAQSSGSETMMNMGPVLLNHGSRQSANDNSKVLFYPTGPPVPFLTMLPFNYAPPETRNADVAATHFNGEQGTDNSDQKAKPDILHSDFASHYQNLLFGRFCQSPHSHGGGSPVGGYPQQPVVVPPIYVQGRVPFDGPGRPNMNVFSQLVGGYGPRLVPVGPFQSGSNRPPPVYQHYVEEIPRPRSGTGTYLPNLQNVSPRERNPSGPRRGSYNYDRSDSHVESERNWNSTKSRGRNNTRNQNEKNNSRIDRSNSNDSRTDRPWNSNRRDSSSSSYQGYNSHLRSSTSQSADPSPSMVYSMYPEQGMSSNGVSSNGPVMVYPLDHANYDMHTEQFAFGSFGPGVFSNLSEQRQDFDGQRIHGERSSPDQPSSPHF